MNTGFSTVYMLMNDIKSFINNVLVRSDNKIDSTKIKNNGEWIKNNHYDIYLNILNLTSFLDKNTKFSARLYHIVNDIWYIPQCKECGKQVNFINFNKGYYLFCSSSCGNINEDTKNIRKNKCLIKRGVDHHLKDESIINKRKDTCLKKYGVDNASKAKEIKKIISEKYKLKTTDELNKSKQKYIKTHLKKYGVDHPFKSEKIQNKARQTFLRKYGVNHPLKSEKIQNKIKQTRKNNFVPILTKMLDYLELDIVGNYDNAHDLITFKCRKCGHEFEQQWNRIQQGYMCPVCYPRNQCYSKGEKELCEFVKSLGFNVIENTKAVIPPLELDIYIPEKNIAIEYNGLYWHSEINGCKDRNYHLNKLNQCTEKNIRLIQIFEDEWIYKQDIVKSILLSKMGIYKERVYAKNCVIKEIDNTTKNSFLENNHLQGKDNSSVKLGLFNKEKLVSVMTFGKRKITGAQPKTELIRYATALNTQVVGGASKLFKFFVNLYNFSEIVSYADRRFSDGIFYKKLGFNLDHISKPNYWYIINNIREHRVKWQKHKLKNKLNNYNMLISEWENMKNNEYDRIWDCGNYVFYYKK